MEDTEVSSVRGTNRPGLNTNLSRWAEWHRYRDALLNDEAHRAENIPELMRRASLRLPLFDEPEED